MRPLWSAQEIATATGGTASGAFDVNGVAFDSREISTGDLFVALNGETTDGHRFIDIAIANGAAGILCEMPIKHPHVLVSDSAKALADLGRAARARSDATIIGVTGSAGKTGTKQVLFNAFDRASDAHAHQSVKSYNNHVGVPLSLARMPAHCQFGVFEMGMNHSGELSALTDMVRPHIAIITTVAPAHIGHFKDESEIADAKAEIFEGLQPGGVAIIPRDNVHYARLNAKAQKHAAKVVTFGRHAEADVRVLDHVRAIGGGTLVTAQINHARLCYTIAAPGEHWVMNSLALLAAVEAAGGDLAVAGLALADMPGLAGRGERFEIALADGGGALIIDESYNANPASMAVTIASLGQESATRRVVVLGAMKELGTLSEMYHFELASPIAQAKIDMAILVGDEMHALADALRNSLEHPVILTHVDTAEQAQAALAEQLRDGDAVLIKGSNSVGLSKVVKAITKSEAHQEA